MLLIDNYMQHRLIVYRRKLHSIQKQIDNGGIKHSICELLLHSTIPKVSKATNTHEIIKSVRKGKRSIPRSPS